MTTDKTRQTIEMILDRERSNIAPGVMLHPTTLEIYGATRGQDPSTIAPAEAIVGSLPVEMARIIWNSFEGKDEEVQYAALAFVFQAGMWYERSQNGGKLETLRRPIQHFLYKVYSGRARSVESRQQFEQALKEVFGKKN